VFPEDREECLAAGMDGVLAKPVTRRSLDKMLNSIVHRLVAEPASPPDAPLAANAGPAAVFDASIYDGLKEALGAEDAMLVLRTFLDDAGQRLAAVHEAASQGDNETIAREAHALKSSAATLGFMRLAQLARQLEANAGAAVDPVAPAQVMALADAYRRVSRYAQDHIIASEPAAIGAIQ